MFEDPHIDLYDNIFVRKISGNPRLFNCRDESARKQETKHMFEKHLDIFAFHGILYV